MGLTSPTQICFNSRTPGGVRQAQPAVPTIGATVSIHAPREGCDSSVMNFLLTSSSFNSRTPGGVRRRSCRQFVQTSARFNSRTPGGVRQELNDRRIQIERVSIHAPREGCDQRRIASDGKEDTFQFTHPGRGATRYVPYVQDILPVSIHAPREGCDRSTASPSSQRSSFNSRTPGGVRRRMRYSAVFEILVSIHAPREGCDASFSLASAIAARFQFTHPGRGATSSQWIACDTSLSFNSRTPGGVRRRRRRSRGHTGWRFNSRTPGGVRLPGWKRLDELERVSIHAPREGCDLLLD